MSCSSAFFRFCRCGKFSLCRLRLNNRFPKSKPDFKTERAAQKRNRATKNYFSRNSAPAYESGLPLSNKTFVFDYNFSAVKTALKTPKKVCKVFRKFNQPFR